ncbi:succinate receptor 1-like [Chanos chanos]|uniref:Succinate receptor 1-like n=1 Tax=Chanos chanos TaxID=29144 RepID=A0A6J2VQ39_CHACN|nr:succinate receptor 1 [Chanos chanos]
MVYESSNKELHESDIIKALWRYYLSPAYAVEFTLGALGNLVVILVYVFCLSSWKSSNVYLFNLAVSDLIFLCTLPGLAYNYSHGIEEIPSFMCIANRYILHVNLYSSILFMAWVSVDRLLLLHHLNGDHVLLTLRSSIWVSFFTWVAVNILIAPLISFIVKDMASSNWTKCNDFGNLSGELNMLGYSLCLTVIGYLLPLLALFASSYQITSILKTQQGVFGTSFQRPLRAVKAAAIMFLVLYLPYHVMRNIKIATQNPKAGLSLRTNLVIEAVYTVTRPVAFAHSVINPVFYFLITDSFRDLMMGKLGQIKRRIFPPT